MVRPVFAVASRRSCRPRRRPGTKGCCVRPKQPPDRPDPAIYSQIELLSEGIEPTWASPDITTNDWGPWRLRPESEVKVRNLSPTASAVGTAVHVHLSSFGIGMPKSPLSTRVLNVGPGQEVALAFALSQAVLTGPPDIGIHVTIEHSTDRRLSNNRGSQQVHGAFTSEAGRSLRFQFPVRNPAPGAQQITLATLTNDVGAAVTPTTRMFAPFEQVLATVTMAVPGTIHGAPGADVRREVTVVGWDTGGTLIDGLTYILRIDD
jgi:hypothetical protein